MAVQQIEDSDPLTQVRFLNLACSGASISKTISQLKEAARLTSGQQIDILIISVGGNDIDFGPILATCAALENCYQVRTSPLFPPDLNEQIRKIRNVDEKLQQLSALYDDLAAEIEKFSTKPKAVYITEYFEPTHDELRHFCHMLRDANDLAHTAARKKGPCEKDVGVSGWLIDLVDFLNWAHIYPSVDFEGITPNESEWLFNNVVRPLNSEVAKAAEKHGWEYVGRVMSAFATHGGCASDNWVLRGRQSFRTQDDTCGTLHPNQKGHGVYRDRLVKFILEGGRKLEVKPSWNARGPVYVSREEQGTFTYSCVFDASNPSTPLACMPEVFLTVVAYDPNGIGRTAISIDGVAATYREFGDQFSKTAGPHDLNGAADCTSVEQREETVITEYDPESNQTWTVTQSRLLGVTDVRPGLVCNVSRDNEFEAVWFFKIIADGTYRIAFGTAPSDAFGVARKYDYEIRVGLQEPPPTAAGPRVLEATLEARPSQYQGLCAATIQFSGRISVDSPGLVSYRFVRSDGTKGPVTQLAFAAAGPKDVNATWSVGSSGRTSIRTFNGWQAIEILEPDHLESNRASFMVTFEPRPPEEPCAPEGRLCP